MCDLSILLNAIFICIILMSLYIHYITSDLIKDFKKLRNLDDEYINALKDVIDSQNKYINTSKTTINIYEEYEEYKNSNT